MTLYWWQGFKSEAFFLIKHPSAFQGYQIKIRNPLQFIKFNLVEWSTHSELNYSLWKRHKSNGSISKWNILNMSTLCSWISDCFIFNSSYYHDLTLFWHAYKVYSGLWPYSRKWLRHLVNAHSYSNFTWLSFVASAVTITLIISLSIKQAWMDVRCQVLNVVLAKSMIFKLNFEKWLIHMFTLFPKSKS